MMFIPEERRFFVAEGVFIQRVYGRIVRERQMTLREQCVEFFCCACGAHSEALCNVSERAHSDGYGIPVGNAGVVVVLFDSVTERMTEVKKHSFALFALVVFDHLSLDGNAAGDNILKIIADVLFDENVEKLPGFYHAILHDLRHTIGEKFRRQAVERVNVAQDELRLIESADKILAACDVDGGLASD